MATFSCCFFPFFLRFVAVMETLQVGSRSRSFAALLPIFGRWGDGVTLTRSSEEEDLLRAPLRLGRRRSVCGGWKRLAVLADVHEPGGCASSFVHTVLQPSSSASQHGVGIMNVCNK